MYKTLKKHIESMLPEHFETIKFKDLEIGDKFTLFPAPGDNSGHGGYKGGNYLFVKISEHPIIAHIDFNCFNLSMGNVQRLDDCMDVIKII